MGEMVVCPFCGRSICPTEVQMVEMGVKGEILFYRQMKMWLICGITILRNTGKPGMGNRVGVAIKTEKVEIHVF
tara:strand:- start:466 stop:687 length:222 start_codon:yes stop_codon:yes gene_type:complete